MNFIPTYETSCTEAYNKCNYCHRSITFHPNDTKRKTYKINNKHICLSCLRRYASILGMTVKDLVRE